MKRHTQIKSKSIEGSCNFMHHLIQMNLPVSKFAFKRYTLKSNYVHSPSATIRAYKLPCGCYIWVNKNGSRELSLLPF